jgi:hypothetical protein
MAKVDLTAQRLRELLHYDPETGEFLWRTTGKGRRQDCRAGTIESPRGYVFINIDGRIWRSHRLAWLYVHGEWPKQQIDHINGNKTDNRIANLRDVSSGENTQNRSAPLSNNKSGFLGVTWKKTLGRWVANICHCGTPQYLGAFDTPEEASAAYLAAKRRLHRGCVV